MQKIRLLSLGEDVLTNTEKGNILNKMSFRNITKYNTNILKRK